MILFTRGCEQPAAHDGRVLTVHQPDAATADWYVLFHETLTSERIVSLAFFGAALVLYSVGMARRAKAQSAPAAAE